MKKLIVAVSIVVFGSVVSLAQELTFTFSVDGLSCQACANTAASTLKSLAGVKSAHVDFASGRGTVVSDGAVTKKQLKEAIATKNFEAVFVEDTRDKTLTTEQKAGLDITIIEGGGKLKFRDYLNADKITIFDFYADWCGPCKLFSPKLEMMLLGREDLALVKVDVVDWKSQIAKQLTIKCQMPALPFTLIFDDNGRLLGKVEGNNIGAVKEALEIK